MTRTLTMTLLAGLLSLPLAAQETDGTFTNPVIRGDVPDPSVIRIGDTYYAAGTSSEWAPQYPLFTSKDLVNWRQIGHVFDSQPEWTVNSFWAPELFYHNGKVYCYYTARERATGMSYIGVATADSPEGPFTDHGILIRHGKEAIDAFVYDDNGQLYISWKAYGLEPRPIEIIGSKLSADGLRLEGKPFTMLVDEERVGMEGQYHFKQGDYYYIIYASHGCCGINSDYDVCVARSKQFDGKYEKYEGNPILHGGKGDYKSCGHGTAVTTPDGRMYYLCHAYLGGDGFYVGRQPILQEMEMTPDHWIRFKTGDLATVRQPMPFSGTVLHLPSGFTDDFDEDNLKVEWTWNYPYSDVTSLLRKGSLLLSGTPKEGSRNGAALCVRPQTPDYSCETEVACGQESLKGLTLYGDDQNLIVWGVTQGRLVLKVVKDSAETVLYEGAYDGSSVHLKLTVEQGLLLRFYYSRDGKKWKSVQDKPFSGESLLRWDRVQRPGLLHCGDSRQPGKFMYFRMKNL